MCLLAGAILTSQAGFVARFLNHQANELNDNAFGANELNNNVLGELLKKKMYWVMFPNPIHVFISWGNPHLTSRFCDPFSKTDRLMS
jgi:hypothetical protein